MVVILLLLYYVHQVAYAENEHFGHIAKKLSSVAYKG